MIYPADKYKGSVMGGLFKMMEYKLCVTKRSVNLIKELKNYVYELNKDGKFIFSPFDAYYHLIDAARYWTIGKIMGKVLLSKQYDKDDLGLY